MVLLAFLSTTRPTAAQRVDLITVFESVDNLNFDTLGIVFTQSDKCPSIEKHAADWVKALVDQSKIAENYTTSINYPKCFVYSSTGD
tara:strand:- start:655 stop:915 length:261 start_codon:yes stop_codon:yes gene_type:complete